MSSQLVPVAHLLPLQFLLHKATGWLKDKQACHTSPLRKALCRLCPPDRTGGKVSRPARPCVPGCRPPPVSPLTTLLVHRASIGQLASVPRSPVTAFARMFSPVVFPWTILSPQGGLISRLKKLPKALSAGYVLYSFRNCPLYLLAHFPHARCKCSEGGSLACPAPRGTRACDPQQPLSRPCWENAPVASGF